MMVAGIVAGAGSSTAAADVVGVAMNPNALPTAGDTETVGPSLSSTTVEGAAADAVLFRNAKVLPPPTAGVVVGGAVVNEVKNEKALVSAAAEPLPFVVSSSFFGGSSLAFDVPFRSRPPNMAPCLFLRWLWIGRRPMNRCPFGDGHWVSCQRDPASSYRSIVSHRRIKCSIPLDVIDWTAISRN
jgi:hypothetical protein